MTQNNIINTARYYYLPLKHFFEHPEVAPILLAKSGKNIEDVPVLYVLKPIRQFLDDHKKKRDNNLPINWDTIRKASFKNYL